MLISDSVRQEDMPIMVYYLCKLVNSGKYNEDQIVDLITASTVSGYKKYKGESNPINDVIRFARDEGKFVSESADGTFETAFSKEQLSSFDLFMQAVVSKIELDDSNKFNKMLKWLLVEKRELSKYTKTADFPVAMNIEGVNDENIIHGFLFWAEAMGIIAFEGKKSGTIVYTLEEVMGRYISSHQDLKKRGAIPAREFFEELSEAIFFIPMCLYNNTVSYALSQGIRILEQAGVIELVTVKDSGDSWHLYHSDVFVSGNNFTNIRVC